ncbi:3-hydroxyacyl-CoA-acyl carrier protein transferase [Pseudomonas syringae pv. philadelphi]|nr:3-hydroxyacyl-CoA-acyl carrier protein transferase [Pseudomonas syringae pv. berberidis]KPY09601.1 3-hydroxyacyl-CoA-acyl carrier protein transferase [Pseudomonas syringae pv. philadelphi]RMM28252.1 3-hydroxyacyl-CoA-acyl carrier protein transferase [Pseudomonas syringae pv. berberidis]RMP63526.1 3-hydroxyacyl-CoA-acyl carrier protein transferase [Pseudomonas syringae pv. berberidis]RMQ32932.1 3-hydroxyacyl-CoA-acyl carrier protein transferase [Pseudomonas syringae pv. berberidis]
MEHKAACNDSKQALMQFLQPGEASCGVYRGVHDHRALAF